MSESSPALQTKLHVDILPQPDDTTCGPTCLHALYRYYGDELPLDQVVREVPCLTGGGTLAVLLGNHALARGYAARIYTYNLHTFDPTWFGDPGVDLCERLRAQLAYKHSPKLRLATKAYLEFLECGGQIRFEDLTIALLTKLLNHGCPVLTGLSSTYLYRSRREYGPHDEPDDLRGEPQGHFVILCGYDRDTRLVQVADPLSANPLAQALRYSIPVERVLCSILLGIVTYDANMLIIEPRQKRNA